MTQQTRIMAFLLGAVLLVKEAQVSTALASGCKGGKDCEYKDPVSKETISYDIGAPGLKDGECPPASDKMIKSSCHIVNYKEKGEKLEYRDCKKHGQSCSKHAECCQSYVRSKSAANLPVIMFPKCIKGKCVACLKNLWPCGGGSKIPCCGYLEGGDISCRHKRDVSFTSFLPHIWPLCAPPPCHTKAMEKLNLYQSPCFSWGKDYPQYFGVNMCDCGMYPENSGTKCNKDRNCVSCKLEGFGEESACQKDEECCQYHECKEDGSKDENGKLLRECFQKKCILPGQRDTCDGKDDEGNDLRCCDPTNRCLVVNHNNGTRFYSLCTAERCAKEGSSCEVDFHCCDPLKCLKKKIGNENHRLCSKE